MAIDPGEFDELKKTKVSWVTRALLAVAVPWGLGRLARELGGSGVEMSKKAHSFFEGTGRVDVAPLRSELRGFQIVIDNMLSLYFIQDGDHFAYDGFEMGLYEDGDVTIFDPL